MTVCAVCQLANRPDGEPWDEAKHCPRTSKTETAFGAVVAQATRNAQERDCFRLGYEREKRERERLTSQSWEMESRRQDELHQAWRQGAGFAYNEDEMPLALVYERNPYMSPRPDGEASPPFEGLLVPRPVVRWFADGVEAPGERPQGRMA